MKNSLLLPHSIENIEDSIPVELEVEDHEKRNDDFNLMENAMSKIGEPCKSLLDGYYLQKKNELKLKI